MKVTAWAALGVGAQLALALSVVHAQSTETRLPTAVITPAYSCPSLEGVGVPLLSPLRLVSSYPSIA